MQILEILQELVLTNYWSLNWLLFFADNYLSNFLLISKTLLKIHRHPVWQLEDDDGVNKLLIYWLIWLCMIFSKKLSRPQPIHLQVCSFYINYYHHISVTFASFHSSGNSLLLKVLLKSFCRISEQHSLLSFRIFGGIIFKNTNFVGVKRSQFFFYYFVIWQYVFIFI